MCKESKHDNKRMFLKNFDVDDTGEARDGVEHRPIEEFRDLLTVSMIDLVLCQKRLLCF
jgi:hypothetical protein